MKNPKLSVCIITYNHEAFIRENLESVLCQKTDFDYEIIIRDDCSTDNTQQIIREYCVKYPDKISPIFCERNTFAEINPTIPVIDIARGEYITVLEGDDYWCNENKLQMQVDFLDNNKEYSSCCTRYYCIYEEEGYKIKHGMLAESFKDENYMYKRDICAENFVEPYLFHTSTIVFRKECWSEIKDAIIKYKHFKDLFLQALLVSRDKSCCLNEFTSVYRVNLRGVWGSLSNVEKLMDNNSTKLEICQHFKDDNPCLSRHIIGHAISELKIQNEDTLNPLFLKCLKMKKKLMKNESIIQRIKFDFKILKNYIKFYFLMPFKKLTQKLKSFKKCKKSNLCEKFEEKNQMKISIITVVKNAEKTIENTILSILNQTYKNIEFIMVDGGSTDGTLDIIEKYKDKISYFISEPDTSIYNAMNKGIKAATGDVLFFLNANDTFYDENVLQDIEKEFKNSNAEIIFGDIFFTPHPKLPKNSYNFEPNKVYKYDFITSIISFYYRNPCHQVIFYKKTVFDKVGLYNENYKIYADYEFNIRAFINHKLKCRYIDRVIANFELGGISTIKSEKYNEVQKNELDGIIKDSAIENFFKLYHKWYLFMSQYLRTFLRKYDSTEKLKKIVDKILIFTFNGKLNKV